ncbi:MAG: PAS domain S-box protein [Candidatus Thorarchaeota archaeon]
MTDETESHYLTLFEDSPVSLWEEDFSQVKAHFDKLRASGVSDFRAYFGDNFDEVLNCAELVEIVRVNRATIQLQGVEDENLLLGSLGNILAKDAYDLFRDELVALAEGEIKFKQVVELATVTGETKHVLMQLSVPEESRESLKRVIVSMMDITDSTMERKAFERERKAFKLIAEAALEPTYSQATSNRIISGLVDLLEYDLGTLRLYDEGSQVLRLDAVVGIPEGARSEVPLDDQDYIAAHVARTKSPIFESDIKNISISEARRAVIEGMGIQSLIFWPILGANEELLGVLNIAARKKKHLRDQDRDLFQTMAGMLSTVLARHLAQDALRSSEERFRLLAENAKDVIWTIDLDFKFTYISPACEEVLGYSPKELMGEDVGSLMPEETIEIAQAVLAEALALEDEVGKDGYDAPPLELELLRKDGTRIWTEISRAFLRDNRDKPVGILGIARDITERKRTERKLEEALTTAAFYNDLMAHDISNLQQGIMSSMELMLESGKLHEHLETLAKSALAQTQRGAKLVMNVKKLAALGEVSELIPIDPHMALAEAIEMVHDSYPSLNVKINTNFSKDQYSVLADEFLVDVFYNLLHNSVRMDTNDVIVIDVVAEDSEEEKFLTIKVQDRGPGISDTLKKAILTRFGDREKRGSGLGLTLVRRIMHRYGGRIWVEDRVQGDYRQGTSMAMMLPKTTA